MPVKYQCPKCGKRFVDWGAAKLNFLCPECPGTDLTRMGEAEREEKAAPKLKRSKPASPPKKKVVEDSDLEADESFEDGDFDEDDLEEEEAGEEAGEEEEGEEAGTVNDAEADSEEEDTDDDVAEDLDFENESGAIEDFSDED